MSEAWWMRLGVALDETLNVLLLDGEPEETISVHAAEAARARKWWGCVLCRWLDRLVQPRHCARALEPGAARTEAAVRGGVLMAVVIAGMWGVAAGAVALLERALG